MYEIKTPASKIESGVFIFDGGAWYLISQNRKFSIQDPTLIKAEALR